MDSADAAPPPKAPPMPSDATPNTGTNGSPSTFSPKPTVASPQEATTATSAPVTPPSSKMANPMTTTRPLATTNQDSKPQDATTMVKLSVPTLKSKATTVKQPPVKAKKLKKKKKKFSSILSGMMKPKKEFNVQAERESLRKTLGGGSFCKIDKI